MQVGERHVVQNIHKHAQQTGKRELYTVQQGWGWKEMAFAQGSWIKESLLSKLEQMSLSLTAHGVKLWLVTVNRGSWNPSIESL